MGPQSEHSTQASRKRLLQVRKRLRGPDWLHGHLHELDHIPVNDTRLLARLPSDNPQHSLYYWSETHLGKSCGNLGLVLVLDMNPGGPNLGWQATPIVFPLLSVVDEMLMSRLAYRRRRFCEVQLIPSQSFLILHDPLDL